MKIRRGDRIGRPGRPRAWACARHALVLACGLSLVLVAEAHAATAQDPAPASASSRGGVRTARVTYLAGGSVYVDAGIEDGLAEGDTLWVARGSTRIAALRAVFLSTRRASCDTLWTRAPLAVDDIVTFLPTARPAVAPATVAATDADSVRAAAVVPAAATQAARRAPSLRGRLGVRWLGIDSPGAARLSQPGIEARFDVREGLGGHLDASFDLRGRRTWRTSSAGTSLDQYSRLYRASATLRDESGGRRLTLGRQTSPTLASVSLFDGALAEWSNPRWGLGAFGGTQPDPVRSRWSSELMEAGVFAEVHQPPLATERWSFATGAVTSRHRSEVDREFAFAQAWWLSRAGSASFAQELDLNRGWKRAAGEPSLAWTSTFATVRVPLGTHIALHSGYDNRRNVRLWRDRETPETAFDDTYRQGAWAGATVEGNEYTSAGGEYRVGSGGERSDTWSVNGEVHRLTTWRALLRARWASFTSDASESSLLSLAAGFDPEARSHVEITSGFRRTRDRLLGFEDTERWVGVDADLALGSRWYLNGGCERLSGPAGDALQMQAGVSVRL